METYSTKTKDVIRKWHLIDADNQVLGRLATSIALLLMGKEKAIFSRNSDCGDYVIITNASKVRLTGNKETAKTYYHHSGYPGGLKAERVEETRERFPDRIITHAVSGMLPNNKLKDVMLKRLFVYAGAEHPHKDKLETK